MRLASATRSRSGMRPAVVLATAIGVGMAGLMAVPVSSEAAVGGGVTHRIYDGSDSGGQVIPGVSVLNGLDVSKVSMSARPALGSPTGGTACAVATGTVYCWGLNNLGQIGDGTTTDRASATAVASGTGLPQGSVTDTELQ